MKRWIGPFIDASRGACRISDPHQLHPEPPPRRPAASFPSLRGVPFVGLETTVEASAPQLAETRGRKDRNHAMRGSHGQLGGRKRSGGERGTLPAGRLKVVASCV